MSYYINVKNNDINDFQKIVREKGNIYSTPCGREIGVNNLIYTDNNIINLLEPYIKTEKFTKRELSFKNTRKTGVLIEQFIAFKVNHRILLTKNSNSKYYKDLMNRTKYSHYYLSLSKNLEQYLTYSYLDSPPIDEFKLINNYLSRFYKSDFKISKEIYKEFTDISHFVLTNINEIDVKHAKEVCLYFFRTNSRKDTLIRDRVKGRIDFISDKCIYDLKCTSKDEKYRNILQVLIYACIGYCHGIYNGKYVKIINPVLNRVHTLDLEEFGIENIKKIFELMFKDFIEGKEVEIINL